MATYLYSSLALKLMITMMTRQNDDQQRRRWVIMTMACAGETVRDEDDN
jgi:hypothetical protein